MAIFSKNINIFCLILHSVILKMSHDSCSDRVMHLSSKEDSAIIANVLASIADSDAYISKGNKLPMERSTRIGVREAIRKNCIANTKCFGSLYYEWIGNATSHNVMYRTKTGDVYTWTSNTIDYKSITFGTARLYSRFVDGNDVLV